MSLQMLKAKDTWDSCAATQLRDIPPQNLNSLRRSIWRQRWRVVSALHQDEGKHFLGLWWKQELMNDKFFCGVEFPFIFKLNIYWLELEKEFPFYRGHWRFCCPRSASEPSLQPHHSLWIHQLYSYFYSRLSKLLIHIEAAVEDPAGCSL